MGDEALKATERQFADLVAAAAGDIHVRLRVFALCRAPRSPGALEYVSARYEPASDLTDSKLDARIITGAEPRAARFNRQWDIPRCCQRRIGMNPLSGRSVISWSNTFDWTAASMGPCAGILSQMTEFCPCGPPSGISSSKPR